MLILLSVSLVMVYNIKLLFIVQLFQQSISVGSNITMLKRAFLLNGIVRVVQLGFGIGYISAKNGSSK